MIDIVYKHKNIFSQSYTQNKNDSEVAPLLSSLISRKTKTGRKAFRDIVDTLKKINCN
jgi:hypothetical protein